MATHSHVTMYLHFMVISAHSITENDGKGTRSTKISDIDIDISDKILTHIGHVLRQSDK